MTRYSRALIPFALLPLLATGCGALDPDGSAAPSKETVAVVEQAIIGEAQLCMKNRYVGVVDPPSASCPVATGKWTTKKLFDNTLDPVLTKYCSYEWPGITAPDKNKLPGQGELLDADCITLAHSGYEGVSEVVRPVLAAAQGRQLEMPPSGNFLKSGTPVRVAVIDSWPSTQEQGISLHGLGLAGIVDGIACKGVPASGSCAVTTTPFLALNRIGAQHELSVAEGGTHGGVADLAQAVHKALPTASTDRVVGLMSVGWDDRINPSTVDPSKLRYSMRALYDVLAQAACMPNVLFIAAAGNATGGPEPGTGPIFPGGFERSAIACGQSSRPILYSVGAVDGRDVPLGNSRPSGRPVLAAPALAVPGTKTIDGVTVEVPPQTGTSVAAAEAAAVAAVVWNLSPALSPAAVMQVVRDNATELDDTADYCTSTPCAKVRRISACDAMAVVGAPVACQNVQVAKYSGNNAKLTSQQIQDVFDVAHLEHGGLGFTSPLNNPLCSIPLRTSNPAPVPALTPAQICPSERLNGDLLLASVDGHERANPCPACFAFWHPGSEVTIDMVISDQLTITSPVIPATLTYLLRTVPQHRVDLGSAVDDTGRELRAGVVAGEAYRVELPAPQNMVLGTTFDAISIEWTNGGLYTTSLLVPEQVTQAPPR